MHADRSERRRPGGWLLATMTGLALTWVSPAVARSSFTARFEAPIAGPELEQTASLVLDLFPGDGEAVVEVRGRPSDGAAELEEVSSSLGQARVVGGGLRVDYRAAPIGLPARDTLRVRLRARAETVPTSLELYSNVDTVGPAHRAVAVLRVVAPLALHAALAPSAIYPGETVEVVLAVDSADPRIDRVEGVSLRWPSVIEALGEPTRVIVGDTLEVHQTLRVPSQAQEELAVEVRAAGAGLRASPVDVAPLRLGTVPRYAVSMPEVVTRDQPVQLTLAWTNPANRVLSYAALEAEARAGLYGARLVGAAAGVELEADEEKGSLQVRAGGPGVLAPGATLEVHLAVVPRVTGPVRVAGFFRPVERKGRVGLVGADVMRVVAPARSAAGGAHQPRTDLELAVAGLAPRLRAALADLPLAPGSVVVLDAERTDEGNWVVESLLTDLLRARGVRVRVDSPATARLRYRLADARVIYRPTGSAWNLFSEAQAREARTEVYLQLIDGRRVRWARRVTAQNREARAPGTAAWLGGARGIHQAVVAADHRALEMGLSGLIAGGLFFVFFAP